MSFSNLVELYYIKPLDFFYFFHRGIRNKKFWKVKHFQVWIAKGYLSRGDKYLIKLPNLHHTLAHLFLGCNLTPKYYGSVRIGQVRISGRCPAREIERPRSIIPGKYMNNKLIRMSINARVKRAPGCSMLARRNRRKPVWYILKVFDNIKDQE